MVLPEPPFTQTHTQTGCVAPPTCTWVRPCLYMAGTGPFWNICASVLISVHVFFFFLILSLNLWVLFFFENHFKFWQLKAFCYSLPSTFFTSTLILENVSSDRFNSIEVFPQNLVIFILVQGRVVHKYVRSWILLKGFPFPLCNW